MKKTLKFTTLALMVLLSFCKTDTSQFKTISPELLKDKIAGGWAGKMIGVTYGAPTEFHALGKIFDDSIKWTPKDIIGSIWQDDIYVQLTFMMTMDKYGIDAPAKKFQEMFAKAGYPLWHANVQARKNFYDSIFPPASGSPEFNIHADDIDFQIEADYLGFMCPGMPVTVSKIADKIGHIMNYGDGVYGGIFVGALYSEAFFENDITKIINNALKSLPAQSDYAKAVADVITLHKQYPDNWKDAWKEFEAKWGDVDICGAGINFNIDAKLNGAYIVMGLLYGQGDPQKTMEITTRCGQDSDCNPSNAMAVLGVIKGFSNLPDEYKKGVQQMGDSIFINTNYSFNKAVESTVNYAIKLIKENGGQVADKEIKISHQEPIQSKLEVAFPDLVFDKKISIFDKKAWKFKGNWQIYKRIPAWEKEIKDQSMCAEKVGDAIELTFNGTGIVINGNWFKDGGKADVFVDGKLNRTIDTYYDYNNQEHDNIQIWHVTGLSAGEHTIKLVVKGEKKAESKGCKIYITEATIFKTQAKKNSNFKFSFEK